MTKSTVKTPVSQTVSFLFFIDCRLASLQYLEWEDVREYLRILLDKKDYLIGDADYVSVLHSEQLSFDDSAPRKVMRYCNFLLLALSR